jgi:hypothetical protein
VIYCRQLSPSVADCPPLSPCDPTSQNRGWKALSAPTDGVQRNRSRVTRDPPGSITPTDRKVFCVALRALDSNDIGAFDQHASSIEARRSGENRGLPEVVTRRCPRCFRRGSLCRRAAAAGEPGAERQAEPLASLTVGRREASLAGCYSTEFGVTTNCLQPVAPG